MSMEDRMVFIGKSQLALDIQCENKDLKEDLNKQVRENTRLRSIIGLALNESTAEGTLYRLKLHYLNDMGKEE